MDLGRIELPSSEVVSELFSSFPYRATLVASTSQSFLSVTQSFLSVKSKVLEGLDQDCDLVHNPLRDEVGASHVIRISFCI